MRVGAIDTGTYVLAKAGLLTGHRCTIHWQNLESFRTEFPDLQVTTNLFEIDRKRFSCSGATAALDLMLYLIGNEYGSELAMQVSEQLIYARLRHDHNGQRSSIAHRLQISDAKLSAALAVMDQEVEAPLVVAEVADRAGLTVRQMERLFERNLGCTPSRYYADLRLNRARTLLNQTTLSVIEIAEGCGFPSYAHFSRSYKRLFGHAPTAERMRHFDLVQA
jgi:transcriptional regulator GlxA family with amidase domain